MSKHDAGIQRPLNFSSKFVSAILVENTPSYMVSGRCMVLNLGQSPMLVSISPMQSVLPLQSTILIGAELQQVERMLVIGVADDLIREGPVDQLGWDLDADTIEEPSEDLRATPLFRSSQDCVGSCHVDGTEFGIESFDIKVNLWFAPAGTNCLIHRYHPFIEMHMQIFGSGRMQKFRSQSIEDMYQEILMSPGFTQPFFNCVKDDANGFTYPWHQYYADTDCIWMAIEFHPVVDAIKP